MHFLELIDVNKIYASQDVTTIGLSNVNIELDLGEFVVITGESGAGKSTLLKIIGGICGYEEGEMLIEGKKTSNYNRENWVNFIDEYISFIHQDYNIMDSFTVYENIETALINIRDKSVRKKKVKELLKKVGLSECVNQKVSKLSGGQKQRVAIARAIAKDSPIILADEPTGNLDVNTSQDVIRVLKELSNSKLVIVVTHDIEEFNGCATREIHIVEGGIDYDLTLKSINRLNVCKKNNELNNKDKYTFFPGIRLGLKILKSKPKLTMLLFVVLTMSSIGLLVISGIMLKVYKYDVISRCNVFRSVEGRVIITKKDGSAISKSEIDKIAMKFGANKVVYCDILIDEVNEKMWRDFFESPETYIEQNEDIPLWVTNAKDIGELDIGRYPEKDFECVLFLPYSMLNYFGKEQIKISQIQKNKIQYSVVGVKYFVDNNKAGQMILTDNGYRINSYMAYIGDKLSGNITIQGENGEYFRNDKPVSVLFDFSVEENKVFIKLASANNFIRQNASPSICVELYKQIGKDDEISDKNEEVFYNASMDSIVYMDSISDKSTIIVINPNTIYNNFVTYTEKNYRQSSLIFESDKKAEEVIKDINDSEYLAVLSSTRYYSKDSIVENSIIKGIVTMIIWCLSIVFILCFISFATKKIIEVSRKDINILQSIGYPRRFMNVIFYSYIICVWISSVLITIFFAIMVYRQPLANRLIMYLSPTYYVLFFTDTLIVSIININKQFRNNRNLMIHTGEN